MKQLNEDFMKVVNEIFQEAIGKVKYKGTSYYYTEGSVGNKKVQYTKNKTSYKGRWGFWSWIATEYKNGKIKRRNFAKSGSRKKVEERAERLLKQLENLKI